MSDNNTQNGIWPLPKFYFRVQINEQWASFQEVSGLETETQIIEYRHSNSKEFSTIKMPGIAKYGNVMLKRGVFIKDNTFWNWYSQISMNTIKRATVLIELLDENGNTAMQWTLANAWPTKITAPNQDSDGNEIAIELLELAHEGITISNR